MSKVDRFWSHEAQNIRCVRESDYDRDTAALRNDYNEACEDAMEAARKLRAVEADRDDCLAARNHYAEKLGDAIAELSALKAGQGEVVAWIHPSYLEPGMSSWAFEASRVRLSPLQVPLYTTPPSTGVIVPSAHADVLAERRRQVEKEGWTPEHDDAHSDGALAKAAACYAANAGEPRIPKTWPWQARFWKPGTTRRMLVKSGALILAEIERIDRAAAQVKP